MLYAVIMAGGIGSRFWPKSRRARPKQFLDVFGETTLIQDTVARLGDLVPPERCLVVTHERYVAQTQEQLPDVPARNILAEPQSRNTAPCIAFAAATLLKRDPEATMMVLPADHDIRNTSRFLEVLRVAALVTIGLHPTYPATGYGYIQFDGPTEHLYDAPTAYPVRTFAEKPDQATAERFIDSGDFLWNSGIFIWRADTIWHNLEQFLPEAWQAFQPLLHAEAAAEPQAIEKAYELSPKISIDYGVMERARSVFVVPGSFGWSDVGDWMAVYDLSEKDAHGNALQGHAIAHDASRCLVQTRKGDKRLVVLVGVHDLLVVDTGDALLVCHRESAQQVKNVVDYLYAHQLEEFV
jgi:mannose-1-phosphate guanylyltransferase